MDSSPTPWLPETELENLNFNDDEFNLMDYLDEELVAVLMGEGCVSPTNNNSSSLLASSLINVESTNPKPNSLSSSFCPSSSSSSAPVLLNFGNPNSPMAEEPKRHKATARIRPPSQTQDHILAERRRREQLSRYFLALSKIVPGLKKMDKTSILGDTITHLKYLQERVKRLEADEEARNKNIQSVVLAGTSTINDDNNKLQLQIEARLCDAQILIKIQCEYRKGLLADLYLQLEKLNLTILNAHAVRFGILALQITIITKMEKEFNSSVNQVLKSLHACCNHTSM